MMELDTLPYIRRMGRGEFVYWPRDEERLREYLEYHNPNGVCKEHCGKFEDGTVWGYFSTRAGVGGGITGCEPGQLSPKATYASLPSGTDSSKRTQSELFCAEAFLSQMKTRIFAIRAYRSSMRLF